MCGPLSGVTLGGETGCGRDEEEAAARSSTVLVVEDDGATRDFVLRTLAQAGLNVVAATSGMEGLAAAHDLRPDLILLDIGLPDVSGFDVCAELKRDARTANVPIIFLSASYVSAFDRVRGLEGGADIYLSHPIESSVLVATVRALLRATRMEREREQALARERQARQAAEAAQQRLAVALHGREDALANVVHDLRTPLQTVDLAALYLRGALTSPQLEGARRQVVAIQRASRQMSSLVGNLLDLAQLQAGTVALQLADVDVVEIIDDTFESHRLVAEEKRLVFERVLPVRLRAHADPVRLQQVLANLVANAIKFTPAGGDVALGAHGEGAEVVLWVQDNGPGIPPEQLPHVFERFWQDRKRRGAGGLGLGLAIAKGIVDAHGGRIWLDSRLGEGTRVSFSVPQMR